MNNVKLSDALNDRKITIIIKNEFLEFNKLFLTLNNFTNNNFSEEPPIEQIQENNYCYYKNFELIDVDIYQIIFNNDEYAKNGNLRECYFENNYMYFRLPPHFCGNKQVSNIEIGILNPDNSFTANFLMECNSVGSFRQLLENAKQNGGFDKFLISYLNNTIEQLYDNNGNPIGIIYNLMPKVNLNNNFNNNINMNNLFQNSMQNWNNNNGSNNFNYLDNFNNIMFDNNYLLKTQPLKQVPFKNQNFKKIREEFKTPPLISETFTNDYDFYSVLVSLLSRYNIITAYSVRTFTSLCQHRIISRHTFSRNCTRSFTLKSFCIFRCCNRFKSYHSCIYIGYYLITACNYNNTFRSVENCRNSV